MEELIKLLFIYGISMLVIKVLSNKNKRNQYTFGRTKRKVIYEERITKNGEKINIKRTYTDGDLEDRIPEINDIVPEKIFDESKLQKDQEKLEQINKAYEKSNNVNRHSYMYQDIEQEIIKIDHTFSKEVFLNNAKEIFTKYQQALVKGDLQDLKQYSTKEYINLLEERINHNKKNKIKVVVENLHIYNAFLYEFGKSTDKQVITVKLKAEMRTYEINDETQYITKGNKYATVEFNYEMQFARKPQNIKCQSCGASVNMKNLAICEYCGTPAKVENNEWKLNYINILKD
ncbi:MAG: Tim44 domain-containing protein [Clostridia bacterium]|nr:Tim44 domain-containing protein [Clostridia bacterium]